MSRRVALGIDPGVSGGIVALWSDGEVETQSLSCSPYDIWDWLAVRNKDAYACVEKVGGFIGGEDDKGRKVNKASAHTMFTFGKSAGWIEMALVGNRIPHQSVLPSVWQSVVDAPKKQRGERQDRYKTRLRQYAHGLCDEKLTKATADAFLIALYCARIRGVSWRMKTQTKK